MAVEPIGRITALSPGLLTDAYPWKEPSNGSDGPASAGRAPAAAMPAGGDRLDVAVAELNRTARAFEVHAEYRIHEESGRVMVRIIDDRNDEVIREIPPERVLALAARIQELLGFVIDEQA